MQHNVELIGKMMINAHGNLQFTSPAEKTNHTETIRRDMNEMERLICTLTGWSIEDLQWNKMMLGAKWIQEHTGSDHTTIFSLMNMPEVSGWWRLHWHHRDEHMAHLLVSFKERQYHCTNMKKLQLMMRDKYIRLHLFAFNIHTYQYTRLEDSYAKLF